MTRIDKILKPLDDLAAQYRQPRTVCQQSGHDCKAYDNAGTLALLLAANRRGAVAL